MAFFPSMIYTSHIYNLYNLSTFIHFIYVGIVYLFTYNLRTHYVQVNEKKIKI